MEAKKFDSLFFDRSILAGTTTEDGPRLDESVDRQVTLRDLFNFKYKKREKKVLKNDTLPKRCKNSLLLECVTSEKPTAIKLIELRRYLEQKADVNTTDFFGYTPLHLAVQHEKAIIIKLLLKWGANVNTLSKYNKSPLYIALSCRDLSVVELLINKGADVNARDTFESTPLCYAVERCKVPIVELLLNRGADVNAQNKVGTTSLYLAVKSKNKPVVELLLNNGADANVKEQTKGSMPLHEAVRLKDEYIVELLLDKGADVNAKINDEKTSLHLAVKLENTAMVALLLSKGANVNVNDKDGETPLQEAVRRRKKSIVKLLLDSGADVNAKAKSGYTSLHVAANTRQTDIMELLLDKSIDVNAKIRGDDTLHMATRFGKPAIVEMLLNKGADVNAQTADGYTLLHEAARSGKVPVVELLLNKGATVNSQTSNGNTPLHEAARSMEVDVVELLLNKGADVTTEATNGYTPMHVVLFCLQNYMAELLPKIFSGIPQTKNSFSVLNFAAFFGPHSIVELLLNKGADVNVQIENGYTLLHYAARSGEKSAVELLLNKGADVNLRTNDQNTVLHYAARSGNISVVELLLNKDADVNTQNIDGYTPLHGAARSGILPLCDLLLNKGANVRAQTIVGHTPLHEAVRSKVKSVVELLLNKGADVNAKGKVRGMPLQEAARSGEISMVELLINNGAEVNARDNFGNTAFHKAVNYKKTAVIEFLLSKGADVNAQDESGDTPLHETTLFKEILLIELLVNNGANVNSQNNYGETPLHNAAYSGDTSILKLLLEREANVNASSRNRDTVLHRAVQSNELDIVKLLLKKGAKVNVQNSNGNTPLHEAVRYKNVSITDMLVSHGADVLLRNKADDTPLSIALLFSVDKSQYLVSLLESAEKKANDKDLVKNCQLLKPNDTSQTIEQDIITNNRLQNDKVKYSKTTDTSGLPGQLYETKILSLVLIRVLKHELIEHDIFLGVNVNEIGAMDDICLRYQVKGQQRPTVLFMQAKHREDPKSGKLTEKALWSDSGDFSLRKYFASYLMIRERFQVGNKDPMFEGDFCDADCYFVLYTSAKDSLMKKKTENKSEILHDLINTGQNTEPFQYNYDEDDIANLLKEAASENQINQIEYNTEHVKDFFNRLWFYSNQGRQGKVECEVKDEINRHYNNKKDSNHFKFDLHTNAIFLKVHHEIQEWWKLKGKAPYLSRSNDFFRLAKIACLADVLLIVGNAMNDLKLSVDLEFKHIQRHPLIETPGILNSKLCKLLKIINTEDMSVTVDMNLKNEIVKFLLTDSSDQILEGARAQLSRDSQDVCNLSNNGLNTISNNDLYNNDIFEYSKKDGTSEVGGALFRMKMLCLVLLRVLNHEQIEQSPLLGTKIRGISFLNDICLRYKVKSQQRPVVLFMQLIHREDPEKGQLTNDEVWSDLGNFSLRKFFRSYFEIKDQFHVGNKDPMFEGDFSNVDCHFILYTSAKENLTKKKQNDEMSDLLKNIINTKCNSEPFQYDHDEADIVCLTKVTVMDRIVKLGTNFLKSKDLKKSEINKPNILADKVIARYHAAMGRKVLKPSETQSVNNDYRIWEFRSEFFDSDDECLVALRRTFVETVSSRRSDQGNINVESERGATENNKLLQLKFKLPTVFGNLDMAFRGSEDKAQKRMKFVADKLMQLLKLNCVTKIVEINEEDVGPEKTLEQDIMDVNGGIGSAVGNLLILDTHTSMLKFDLENKDLPRNAALFLKELKNDRHKPYNEDLSIYRLKININDFPQDSFKEDEFDKRQAKDFLSKFWYYPNQGKDVIVESVLKKEISKKYSENKIHPNKNRNISDIISLNYCHQIQMWWMQTCDSPYLSRASELFEHAELADMYNLLQTVINYMYISDIHTIDIKVKQVNKDEEYDQMHKVFKKMTTKLFNLFDPEFNKPIDFSYNLSSSKKFDFYKLSLRIHPKMAWVSLYMTAGYETNTNTKYEYKYLIDNTNVTSHETNVSYRIFAKVGLSSGCQQKKDTFVIYEQTFNESLSKSYTRDCLANTFL